VCSLHVAPGSTLCHEPKELLCLQILNPENASCAAGSGGICVTQLVNPFPVPKDILNELPDINYLLTFGFYALDPTTLFNSFERYIGNVTAYLT
jgi:hypothetical protein